MIVPILPFEHEGKVKFTARCVICRKGINVELTSAEYHDYFDKGMHIQHAMPEVKAEMRELLISGTCPDCWNEMFPPEEDEG